MSMAGDGSDVFSKISHVLTTPPGLYFVIGLGVAFGFFLIAQVVSCAVNTKRLCCCCCKTTNSNNPA